MTQNYLTDITPDNISGILFALEGIDKVVTLLNGPTGCKYFHSSYSERLYPRRINPDFMDAGDEWFFNQPRVPCTYLDRKDYVYGSKEKLKEGVAFLKEHTHMDLLCVVNSPGAALIGDDLAGILEPLTKDIPLVTIQTPGFSGDIFQGHEKGVIELLRCLEKEGLQKDCPSENRTVNLLGLSIYQYYHEGDLAELKRLLSLCGIKVHCSLCCGSSLEEITSLKKAALNIVIRSEYGIQTADYLEKTLGIPYYVCDSAPIGFSATSHMIREISSLLGADSSPYVEECNKSRARAYQYLYRLNSLAGLPQGVSYSLVGAVSEVSGYTDFLTNYLGMAPRSILLQGKETDKNTLKASKKHTDNTALRKLFANLENCHCENALTTDILEYPGEIVLADGNTIAKLKLKKHSFTGIENSEPGIGYVHVLPKTHLGLQGALYLLEQVINGLDFG